MTEPLYLEPIKARLAAATPGPWRWGSWDTEYGSLEDDKGFRYLEAGLAGREPIVRTRGDGARGVLVSEDPTVSWNNPADAALIANAPTDIAALIAEVERLRDRESGLLGIILRAIPETELTTG